MTLQELGKALDEMEPGKYVSISHDVLAELFPPGEPDDRARDAPISYHPVLRANHPEFIHQLSSTNAG
jgi:hypothetical protein